MHEAYFLSFFRWLFAVDLGPCIETTIETFFVNWSSIVYIASQDLLEHYLHLLFYFHKVYFFMPSLLFDKPI